MQTAVHVITTGALIALLTGIAMKLRAEPVIRRRCSSRPPLLRLAETGDGWAMLGGPAGRLWIGAFGACRRAGPPRVPGGEVRAQVRAFHEAAVAAGGRDNGAAGLRPNFGPDYYAAFVFDPDGHNVEAVTFAAP